jgi:hypothetical protein
MACIWSFSFVKMIILNNIYETVFLKNRIGQPVGIDVESNKLP